MKLPPFLLMHRSIINGIWPRSLDRVNSGNVFPGPYCRAKIAGIKCCYAQQSGRTPMLNKYIKSSKPLLMPEDKYLLFYCVFNSKNLISHPDKEPSTSA